KTAEAAGFKTIDPSNGDLLKRVGDWSDGAFADAAIVTIGSANVNAEAATALKKFDGKILLFAAAYPAPEVGLNANEIHYRRLSLIGTFIADLSDFVEAADLLNSRRVDVSRLIEPNRYRLDDIQEAFREASRPGRFRVCVLPNG
ncbi:MAG: alcohol dehydrogenase, partial [Clostridiales Family XIII bacterium]|nr:alcohol dehydrogenase [Clostridiales Family XIII bacterium]